RPARRQGSARHGVSRALGAGPCVPGAAGRAERGGSPMTAFSATPPDEGPDGGHCAGDDCVACSGEAVAVRVLRIGADGLADVDAGDGRVEQVSVALVDAVAGDIVLVHAKEAIGVMK